MSLRRGAREKIKTLLMANKGSDHRFSTLPVFGGKWSNHLLYFRYYEHPPPKGHQIQAIPGSSLFMDQFNDLMAAY